MCEDRFRGEIGCDCPLRYLGGYKFREFSDTLFVRTRGNQSRRVLRLDVGNGRALGLFEVDF